MSAPFVSAMFPLNTKSVNSEPTEIVWSGRMIAYPFHNRIRNREKFHKLPCPCLWRAATILCGSDGFAEKTIDARRATGTIRRSRWKRRQAQLRPKLVVADY